MNGARPLPARTQIPLLEVMLADTERVLGSGHPLTRTVRSNLNAATEDDETQHQS
jgi:hypothetical protein